MPPSYTLTVHLIFTLTWPVSIILEGFLAIKEWAVYHLQVVCGNTCKAFWADPICFSVFCLMCSRGYNILVQCSRGFPCGNNYSAVLAKSYCHFVFPCVGPFPYEQACVCSPG